MLTLLNEHSVESAIIQIADMQLLLLLLLNYYVSKRLQNRFTQSDKRFRDNDVKMVAQRSDEVDAVNIESYILICTGLSLALVRM